MKKILRKISTMNKEQQHFQNKRKKYLEIIILMPEYRSARILVKKFFFKCLGCMKRSILLILDDHIAKPGVIHGCW